MNSYHSNSNTLHSVRNRAWRDAAMAAVGVVVSFSMAGSIGASGLACKPNFKITNDKSKAVKVLSLIYQVEGKDFTEGLSNRKLSSGEESMWKTQSLGKLAEHNAMEKISDRISKRHERRRENQLPMGTC